MQTVDGTPVLIAPPSVPDEEHTLELRRVQQMVEEGLGRRWTDDEHLGVICRYALGTPGKLFRPILLIETARAVGGDAAAVLPAALGAECGHVASLVHDDIIDDDELRRGQPSVQHRYGVDDAIVAGDALIFDLFAALAECRATGVPASRIVAALEAVANCGIGLCRGQSMEARMCRELRFDVDEYMLMAELKTAALFRGACASGAILAGAGPVAVDAVSSYARHLGRAFQMQDDVLEFTGDTVELGKSSVSDVRNGRLTLPVILAHEAGGDDDRARIRHLLGGLVDPERASAELLDIVVRTGALARTVRMAEAESGAARDALFPLPPSPSRDRLERFAVAVVERSR